MRILVTGGAGFIGANLCRTLAGQPEVDRVVALDDLSTGYRSNLDGLDDVSLVVGSILDAGLLDQLVAEAYSWARALNAGTVASVDDVIDPADTRKWLIMGLASVPPVLPRAGKKHAWVDVW